MKATPRMIKLASRIPAEERKSAVVYADMRFEEAYNTAKDYDYDEAHAFRVGEAAAIDALMEWMN